MVGLHSWLERSHSRCPPKLKGIATNAHAPAPSSSIKPAKHGYGAISCTGDCPKTITTEDNTNNVSGQYRRRATNDVTSSSDHQLHNAATHSLDRNTDRANGKLKVEQPSGER